MPEEQAAVQRIVKGAVQTLGSAYTARLINFVVLILLTNILVPGDFGAVEMAFSLLALLVAVRDLGLHYALIHEHDRVHELAPTHFVLSVSLGSASTLLAILMAVYYEDAAAFTRTLDASLGKTPRPTDPKPMVAVALVVFAAFDLLKTAALTAETQLRRDLAFGRLAFAHAGATIFAALLGLTVAYLGGGRWALILGFFPYSAGYVALFCTVVWLKYPPPLNRLFEFNKQAARRLVRYGLWFWVGGVPKVFILHFDKLVIGFLIGLDVRGLYDTAHRFAQMPTGAITLAIVGITGAVYARYQDNRDRLSAAYRRTLRLILRTTTPISCILALEAPRWIAISRPEYVPAAPILQWLILYSLCRPVLDDVHALLYGVGAPKSVAGFTTVQALLLLILAPVLTQKMGVIGTALSMNASAVVGLILALWIARRFVDIPIFKTFGPPLFAAAIGLCIRWVADPWIAPQPALTGFLAGAIVFSTGYGIALLALERKTILNECKTVWEAVQPKNEAPQ